MSDSIPLDMLIIKHRGKDERCARTLVTEFRPHLHRWAAETCRGRLMAVLFFAKKRERADYRPLSFPIMPEKEFLELFLLAHRKLRPLLHSRRTLSVHRDHDIVPHCICTKHQLFESNLP